MKKYEVKFTDPGDNEQSVIVAASGECGAVYMAENMFDVCELVSVVEVVE